MKKLLAILLAGLMLMTTMSVVAWADDEEDYDDVPVDGALPGLDFDSLSELLEYINWLDEDYVSRADEMNFGDGVLEYLYYEMDGLYLPEGVEMDEVKVYVDPRYVDVTFKRNDNWLSLYYFVMGKDGESYTKRLVTMAKNSGAVTTLDNGIIVYFSLDAGTPCYVFVQDGSYYQLYDWSHSAYSESFFEYCSAVYHSFSEAYNFTAEAADGRVKLSWDEVVEGETYTVYWKRSSSDEWKVAGTTTKHKVNISGLKNGVSYDFKVEATGLESEVVSAIPTDDVWADIDGEDVPGSEINNGRAGLTLVEGSVTSTGATFILHNYVTYVAGVDGDLEFGYYERWLQVYENGEWCDVINDYEEDVITPADAAYIEEDGEYQFTVNWGSTYGELPAGHYRYLMRGEYYKEDSFFVACGFDIE